MSWRVSVPPVTRILLGLILIFSFLYNLARWRWSQTNGTTPSPTSAPLAPYLRLVPAMSLLYPWTVVTATLVEQNLVALLVNMATVFFGGKYLERAWGSKGFSLVLIIATVIPNLLVVPTYVIWAAITGNPDRALTPINGGITTQAAFLVAFKQLVPEHTVSIYKGMVKVRVKHFPAIFLAVNTLSGLIFGTDTALILAWYGLVTTWTYLRFYKRQPDLSGTSTDGRGLKGDASETFAFATFFPDVVQPPIATVCNQIFLVLCNLKLCTPFSDEDIATSNEQAAAREEAGLPTFNRHGRVKGMGKREEAERRRALALKALDDRLNAASSRSANPPTTITPSLPPEQPTLGQTDYKPEES